MKEYRLQNDKLLKPVKRYRLLFAVVFVLAFGLAAMQVWKSTKNYNCQASLRYDTVLLAKYAFAPPMDEVIAESKLDKSVSRIAKAAGIPGQQDKVKGAIQAYRSPLLPNNLLIDVTWKDEAQAKSIASATSRMMLDFVDGRLTRVKAYLTNQVDEAKKQLLLEQKYHRLAEKNPDRLQEMVTSSSAINEINSQRMEGMQKLNELKRIMVINRPLETAKKTPMAQMIVAGFLSGILALALAFLAVLAFDRKE